MKPAVMIIFALFAIVEPLGAQEKVQTPVQEFASSITNVIWDLRGTRNLKHLRFNGEKFESLSPTSEPTSTFEHAMLEAGLFRLDFGKAGAGWCFVSDDQKCLQLINVTAESTFKPEEGNDPKPLKNFLPDIRNTVWVGQRGKLPAKLRWNGTTLEVGLKDTHWQVDYAQPIIASRRTIELQLSDKSMIWVVFSADGTTAWWLTISDIFGGHVTGAQGLASQTIGLGPQENDLANHAEDLLKEGHPINAASILRGLLRRYSDKPDVLDHLHTRFPSLKQ